MGAEVWVCGTPACRSIAGTVAGLMAASFREFSADDEDPIGSLCGFHDEQACQWLLLCDGGVALGLAMLVQYHDSMYVASLCVSPAHRGSGGGSLLLRSASALAQSLGLRKLSGSVAGDAASLRSFYSRLGASPVNGSQMGSVGAVVQPPVRLEAPSGHQTDGRTPVPAQLPIALVTAWQQQAAAAAAAEAGRPTDAERRGDELLASQCRS